MTRALGAGLAYAVIVFAAGAVLGALRVGVLMPHLGEVPAVLVELPIILAVSWLVARALIRICLVPATVPARLVMGGTALVLLLAAELGLAVLLLARSLPEHLASYRTAPALLGLAGQIVFGLIPWLQTRIHRPDRS